MGEGLRLDHHDVVEANSAGAFLDQLGSYFVLGISGSPPDVIVTDTEIPGAAGFETLAALRDLDVRVPLVLVAESLDEELRAATGAKAIFVPPFDLDDLRTVVLNLVPGDGWLRTHSLP